MVAELKGTATHVPETAIGHDPEPIPPTYHPEKLRSLWGEQ